MLKKLIVKNVALIDATEIEFDRGLNVLSGETGAGKSILLESVNFVLGAKADRTLIRSGEESCFVQAEFDVFDNKSVKEIFNEFDFEDEDLLIITRKFSVDGKNSIKINGNTATVGMLKKITQALIDVHGQSEHFSLLKNSNQLDLIDRLGGNAISSVKEQISKEYSRYKEVLSELDELGGDDDKRLVKIDILNFQIKEILDADLKDGEDEELEILRKKLQNTEKIVSAMSAVKEGVLSDGGVNDILSQIKRETATLSGLGEDYESLDERLYSALLEIRDIADTASSYIDSLEDGLYDLDGVETRLETIKTLKRKYGNSIDDVKTFMLNAEKEREKLINFNEIASNLLVEKENKKKILYKHYLSLNKERSSFAKSFSEDVKKELRELNMPNAEFAVEFKTLPSFEDCNFTSTGPEQIEFMFSANKGEPVKPLSMIISGGEMSRFMLAIKARSSGYNDISTFIFDEIDSGMSGNTAKIVAQKFANIANKTQIIAITHLPQISAMADNNLLITKIEDQGKTKTDVKKLNEEEKINELARLVGGDKNNETARKLAEELIEDSKKFKSLI